MPYVLVTGGVRSGKSQFAENLAAAYRRVLYVATGTASDEEMKIRIKQHRQRRPASWGLLEIDGDLSPIWGISDDWDALLLDCISTWVGRILVDSPESQRGGEQQRKQLRLEADRLAQRLKQSAINGIVVTSETGLGGVALSPLGRAFQDLLGEVNQCLARAASDVYLVVSGRAMRLP